MNPDDALIADLRARDRDRLYTALFAPTASRERLIGLFSFNLEIASTREKVSEPMLGQIRLQWWRDALDEIAAGTPRAHPVVQSLAEWIAATPEGLGLASALIDAREADLEDAPFETVAALLTYADATSGNLLRLSLLSEGVSEPRAHDAALKIGQAYALAGLLRAVPFLGAQGRVMLPGQLLARHGIMDARQSIGRDPVKLKAVLAELTAVAEKALKAVQIPRGRGTTVLTLHRALTGLYLGRLKRTQFDLSDPRLDPGNAARIARLFVARLRLGRG